VLTRRLRFELSGRIERERRVLLGPPRKSARRLCEEVLRSRGVNEAVARVAAQTGTPAAQLQRRARRLLGEIAANMQPWVLHSFRLLLRQVFSRIYEGIDVDVAGIEKVRAAARKGPLILCPCHRSHVDYLVLSCAFYDHELVPPHIAAGVNLSFFPAGPIFRRGGAFFLRRTFRGDELYAAVFGAYVRKLLREGHSIEFFIEGTRSRTGKLLPPRTGLLDIIAEAVLDGALKDVQVVPISLGYDKVIEERSYAREQAGAEKRPEDVGALLRAGRVLGARYGRLDIEFDDPFDLGAALVQAGAQSGSGPEVRRAAVRRIAYRIMCGIGRVTPVTPTALVAAALLARGRREVTREELLAACGLLAQRARLHGARFERTVVGEDGPGGLRLAALDHTLDQLGRDQHVEIRGARGEETYGLPDERRGALDYYKNGALHFWSDESLLALAILGLGAPSRDALCARVLELSRLLKYELVFRQQDFEQIFAGTLDALAEPGWLATTQGRVLVTPSGREPLELLAGLTRHLLEAYHLVTCALPWLRQSRTERETVQEVHDQAERLFLTGMITRREACSRSIYENALRVLVDGGVLRRHDGRLTLAEGIDAEEQVARVARLLLVVPEEKAESANPGGTPVAAAARDDDPLLR
jgi:glycerol-3-phosphate O-acyltransferase